jgi:hypothetical protein
MDRREGHGSVFRVVKTTSQQSIKKCKVDQLWNKQLIKTSILSACSSFIDLILGSVAWSGSVVSGCGGGTAHSQVPLPRLLACLRLHFLRLHANSATSPHVLVFPEPLHFSAPKTSPFFDLVQHADHTDPITQAIGSAHPRIGTSTVIPVQHV